MSLLVKMAQALLRQQTAPRPQWLNISLHSQPWIPPSSGFRKGWRAEWEAGGGWRKSSKNDILWFKSDTCHFPLPLMVHWPELVTWWHPLQGV